jgi:hypothetical protein
MAMSGKVKVCRQLAAGEYKSEGQESIYIALHSTNDLFGRIVHGCHSRAQFVTQKYFN